MTDLGTLGGSFSYAYGINASGQLVGLSYTAGNDQHAFLDTVRGMVDLGTLGGSFTSSVAHDINASGQIVFLEYERSNLLSRFPGYEWQHD